MLASTIQFTNNTPSRAINPQGSPVPTGPEDQSPDSSKLNSVSAPAPATSAPGSTPTNHKDQQAVLRDTGHHDQLFIDDSTSEHHQCQPDGCRLCGVCAP